MRLTSQLARSSTSGLTHIGPAKRSRFRARFRAPVESAQTRPLPSGVFHLAMATWVQRVRTSRIILSPPITWDAASRGCGASCCLDFENHLLVGAPSTLYGGDRKS